MMKKIFAIVLCISIILSYDGCDMSRKNTDDTDNDVKYNKGFFTDSKYINECVGIKFTDMSKFKFKDPQGLSDSNRHVSNIAPIDFEAMCITDYASVLFYSERIGMKTTMDEVVSNINDRIKEDDSSWNYFNSDDEEVITQDKVSVAGKNFRVVNYTNDRVYKQVNTTLLLRIIGSSVFVIEIACTLESCDIEKTKEAILSSITPIEKDDDIQQLKNDSEAYQFDLQVEYAIAKQDPSVDFDFQGFEKGIIKDNSYTNKSVGLKFVLPEKYKITKIYNTSEFEATKEDGSCSVYIWNENIGCILTMDEYLANVKAVSKNLFPKIKEVQLKNQREELAGMQWSVYLRDMGEVLGCHMYMKQYTRLLKSNAYIVSFQYSRDNEESFNEMKNAFIKLDKK